MAQAWVAGNTQAAGSHVRKSNWRIAASAPRWRPCKVAMSNTRTSTKVPL